MLEMLFSQLFQDVEGWNGEFKLITPKFIAVSYFDTKPTRFGLAGSFMVAILDFSMFIYQMFEQLLGSNLEFLLITPIGPIW